jgi:hypothetical protein
MSARGTARAWAASSHGHPWLIDIGSVHPAYNSSFSACFFSWNSIFLSQQISQQCFSVGLSAQPNGAICGSKWRWRRQMEVGPAHAQATTDDYRREYRKIELS